MNICFVSEQYPPDTGWGGLAFYVHEAAHVLAARGHRIIVVTRALEEEVVRHRDGITVHRILPKPRLSELPVLWRLNRVWRGYRCAVALRLRQIVREHDIDVIEAAEGGAETFFYHLLDPWRRPPIVVRLHSGVQLLSRFEENPQPRRKALAVWMERCAIRWADFVTAPSRAILEAYGDLLQPERCAVYPNSVDLDRFSPGTAPREGSPEVLFVGRFEWHKGPQVLARAIPLVLREMPDVRFSFVGRDWYWTGGGMLSEHLLLQLRHTPGSSTM